MPHVTNLNKDPFKQMMPKLDPLSSTTVRWLGKGLNPSDAFTTSITTEGICYTFNIVPDVEVFKRGDLVTKESRRWSLDDGYPPSDWDAYPRRTFMSGLEGGLMVNALYVNNSHLDYLCQGALQGFKVALHQPCENPNMDKHFRVPLNRAVFVGIKPSLITVAHELIHYPPKLRNCYFEHEKYLRAYNFYTQQNCLDECLANYTIAQCGCIPFHFPPVDEHTDICGPANNECVRKSKLEYLVVDGHFHPERALCECLPSCTSLTYDVETTETDWMWKELEEVPEEREEMHLSSLNVYYKDMQFLSCERKEVYGVIDFFSNVGGLLGLCIGFSVTSAFEILYFLTLRLICNVKKYGKSAWSGDPCILTNK